MLSAQRGKACGGQSAALVLILCVRFLHPTRAAVSTDLVINPEYWLAVKVGRTLAPSHAA